MVCTMVEHLLASRSQAHSQHGNLPQNPNCYVSGLPTQDPEVSTFILEVEDAQRDRAGHLLKAAQVNRQNWDSTPNLAESIAYFLEPAKKAMNPYQFQHSPPLWDT